jgi:hypothetical protein
VLIGATLAVAAAFGVGLGTAIAPRGEASKGPVGFGFLPEPGWSSLQAPTRAPEDTPVVAMVANVPFAAEDAEHGLADPSALPYETLLSLPPHGIVLVAGSVPAAEQPWAAGQHPARKLPLRISTAARTIEPGTQVRPDEPLGQYQVRATVNRRHVDVQVYFGTPRPGPRLLAQAQSQLEKLVVRPASRKETEQPEPGASSAVSAPAVIDRTVRCATSPTGGIYELEARANAGSRFGGNWSLLPFGVASSGNIGSVMLALDDSLAWVTAGKPAAETKVDIGFRQALVRDWGTLAISRTACRPATAKVPLSPAGLQGGAVDGLGDKLDCPAPRKVLVHVRAVVSAKTDLRPRGGFLRTNVPLKSGQIAVTTEKGKPLMYTDVLENGKARLFTAKGCVFD